MHYRIRDSPADGNRRHRRRRTLHARTTARAIQCVLRAQFATIGVLANPFDPDTAMQNLPAGLLAEVCRGAGTGLLEVGRIADGAPSTPKEVGAVYLANMLVLIPPAVIAGSVEGAMDAESQESIDRVSKALRTELAHLNFRMRETLKP